MRAYTRAKMVRRTHLSNIMEARLEEGKVSLRSQEVRPKDWEASGLPKRVKGLLDQQQAKSESKMG